METHKTPSPSAGFPPRRAGARIRTAVAVQLDFVERHFRSHPCSAMDLAPCDVTARLFPLMNEDKINRAENSFTCLVVEDDPAFRSMVTQLVASLGGDVRETGTGAGAQAEFERRRPDLVLLDNHLPDGRGCELYERFNRMAPGVPAIMITGVPDLREAIALTRNGLFDYLTKPVDLDALSGCLRRALLRLGASDPATASADGLGDSPAMRQVQMQLEQTARHQAATVLFTGESGTGKDLAARLLHRLSFPGEGGRHPFVAVNCAAIPGDMFEAEFFGAEKGAYTGAGQKRIGLVEAATGGTLFLDEIGDVPPALQTKLLRLLESGEYRALGGTATRSFRGRLVAATNRGLKADIAAGRFREDLYFRIAVIEIELPPLRERLADVPKLAESLLRQIAGKYSRSVPLLREEDLARLQKHTFPGNVRELRNVLERSLLKTPGESHWLTLDANWEVQVGAAAAIPGPSTPATLPGERGELPLVEAQEYRVIAQAMRDARGGIRRAAGILGMSPQSLLRRLEKWPELRQTG